jgi:hypothetical protein
MDRLRGSSFRPKKGESSLIKRMSRISRNLGQMKSLGPDGHGGESASITQRLSGCLESPSHASTGDSPPRRLQLVMSRTLNRSLVSTRQLSDSL